jgi:hypothetical protein
MIRHPIEIAPEVADIDVMAILLMKSDLAKSGRVSVMFRKSAGPESDEVHTRLPHKINDIFHLRWWLFNASSRA